MMDELALAQLGELAANEDAAMSAVRGRVGLHSSLPSPPIGALLGWVAAVTEARHVVEVGSAAGLTGLWLLRGMSPRGLLTSIEPDPRAQGLATQAYGDARLSHRVRSIVGAPLEVLPRLTDRGYDLVVVQTVDADHDRLLTHLLRVLRPGGTLVACGVGAGAPVELRARRAMLHTLIDDQRFAVAVLPLDGGIAFATLRKEDGR